MLASDIYSEWAKTLAEQLVASRASPPSGLSDDERLALAWALKDAAIAAWSSSPGNVAIAADALLTVRLAGAVDNTTATHAEIDAIIAWVNGIADLTRGKMSEAIVNLDRATQSFTAQAQPAHAAHAQVPKVMALSMLGEHGMAADCGISAQRDLLALGEFHAASKVGINLGALFCSIGDYPSALQHYRDARAIFREVDDNERIVTCDLGMAEALTEMGEFADAQAMYANTSGLAENFGFHALAAITEESLALLNFAVGQYQRALAGMERARRKYAELNMPQYVAMAEKQLGDVYLSIRLLPEALQRFDQAITSFAHLEMHVERAWALLQRGRALARLQHDAVEIASSLRLALELFESQGAVAGQATVLLARAELALEQNDAASALVLATSAARIFEASSSVIGQAQAEVLRAYATLKCGQVESASVLFSNAAMHAQRHQLLSIDILCQIGLGLVAKARGEVANAETAFESAISASEEQRRALPGDEMRSAFLIEQLRPYEEVLRIALEHFDDAPSASAAGRILIQMERFRARVLGERLGEPQGRDTGTREDDTEKHLRARLNWLYRRRQKMIDEGDDPQSLIKESVKAEHELLELARRRRLTTDPDDRPAEVVEFDAAALHAALGQGEAVVEYGVIDNELFACVLTRNRIEVQRRVAVWPEVVEAIRIARFQIETLRYGAGAMESHLDLLTRRAKVAMRRIHDLVWAPLLPLLAGCDRVLIVAHDQLGSVQFAALHDGEQYLAEHMNIAMAASARVALYGLTHQPVLATRALVLGESSRLAHAAEEARFVASLFDQTTVLTEADANAPLLIASCTDADVIHLACHAEFRSDNPMFSALQLADRPFTVHDADALRLRQGIVVLSACETGVAAYSRGDEMIGLVRAFLLAGSARVVASLWPVDDAVTMRFMGVFYGSLRNGNSPSHALRTAQLDIMQTHPHPFHWAAFVLHGGW